MGERRRYRKQVEKQQLDININALAIEKPSEMCTFLLEHELNRVLLNLVCSGKHQCKTKSDFLREAVREKLERDLR